MIEARVGQHVPGARILIERAHEDGDLLRRNRSRDVMEGSAKGRDLGF